MPAINMRADRTQIFQHPLQMLPIFLSTFEFWASSSRIAASPGIGPGVVVPSVRPADLLAYGATKVG